MSDTNEMVDDGAAVAQAAVGLEGIGLIGPMGPISDAAAEVGAVLEAVFSEEQGIPRERLRAWRVGGELVEGVDWFKVKQAFALTVAGQERVMGLAGVPRAVREVAADAVEVYKCRPGVLARVVRAHRVDTGEAVSVRLTGPNVFGNQFRFCDRLWVTPTVTPGVFEYGGKRPRRVRI